MKARTPALLALASVALTLLPVGVAVVLGPTEPRLLLVACALLSVLLMTQAAHAEPRDLAPALLLAAVPVMSLSAEGSPSGVVLPLGVLLFLSCELNSLGWRLRGGLRNPTRDRERFLDLVRLTVVGGVGAGVAYGAAAFPLPTSTLAVGLGALALAGAGVVIFGRQLPPEG
jgi:hypothetical protein